ncbi:MAG: hypothetical protein E6Q98_02960 [Rhodospirillaceae bacterium]|nr:MAG: hypothetical protein E6Q98_02960 [Rhodospirillaceae bacterium]
MVDFVHTWSPEILAGDWLLVAPGLADDADLRTAVIISLFTDRLARPDDVIPDGTADRRGWWADNDDDGLIGSRMWLLSREKTLESVRQRAIEYSTEALQWLIDDGVAQQVGVDASFSGIDRLDLVITVYSNSGQSTEIRFDWVWDQINGLRTDAYRLAA